MKGPCIEYSSTADGQLRNFDPNVQIEIDQVCQSEYGKLERLTKDNGDPDLYKEFHCDFAGSVITYRRPKAGDSNRYCKRRMALWVISID